MADQTAFVVVASMDATRPYPRYSFATLVHARELGDTVRWVDSCNTLEAAAMVAARLNTRAANLLVILSGRAARRITSKGKRADF